MAHRLGLGPVFAFEWLMTARRWQAYAMRSTTVLLLFGAMRIVWQEQVGRMASGELSIVQQAQVGKAFFSSTAMILLGLVGLAAPAAAAGSICLDKARGNLTLLFATDLSDAEIVLGKLGARLVPVLGLILCATPVLSIATLFGGIDPAGLMGALLVVLACAVFGCTLALALSVWGRKTHEVLMATYVFGILYLLSAPILAGVQSGLPTGWWPSWFPTFMDLLQYNPVFLVLAAIEGPPAGMPPVTLGTQAAFLGLGLAASVVLVGVATWRIRRVVIRQLGQGERSSRWRWARWWVDTIDLEQLGRRGRRLVRLHQLYRRIVPGPSLDRNPVLWRECQRKWSSRWGLVLWGIYALVCGGFSLYAIGLMIDGQRWGRELGVAVNALQVAAGLLMLSVSAATSLAEERQRGSLDVLMATPLPTRSIVWGKWWGTFRSVPRLLILPSLVAFAQSFYTGHLWAVALMAALILAYGAAITSLGLALATWMPRLGRAVGTTVGLYTILSIGWIALSFAIWPEGEGLGVAAGSPLTGVGIYSSFLADDGPDSEFVGQTAWTIFWVLAHGGVALSLLLATLATFNRCLGRIDDPVLFDDCRSPSAPGGYHEPNHDGTPDRHAGSHRTRERIRMDQGRGR
jgi:ABC-type transport system involved in multi-copper enzyme maturation permease subunit